METLQFWKTCANSVGNTSACNSISNSVQRWQIGPSTPPTPMLPGSFAIDQELEPKRALNWSKQACRCAESIGQYEDPEEPQGLA
eukprot:1762036-Amphidinium_carterae.3